MSYKDVRSFLLLNDDAIEITENEHSPIQKDIPPFHIFRIRLKNAEIDAYKGAALLTFFNDRLMEVRFFPEKFSEFVDSHPSLSATDKLSIRPFTVVSVAADYAGERYVRWIDSRLLEQFEHWISKFT